MAKKACKNFPLFICIFIALFCILFFTPYATDDYAEKLSVMNATWPECFKSALFYGNGRVFGNLGLLSCLHNDLIRAFLNPLIITVAVFCCIYVFEIKTLYGKLAVALMLVIPAQGYFSNCFAVNPSFYNYVVPICLFTVCLALLKYSAKIGKIRWLLAFILLILSFCMQLFSENSSIIFMLFALGVCVYEFITDKKISVCNIALLIGTVIGLAAIMLLPNYLGEIGEFKYNMSEYRNVYISIPYIIGVLAQFAEIFSSAFIVIAVLSAAEVFLVIKESPEDKFKKWHIVIPVLYSLLSLLYSFIQSSERKVIASAKLALLGLFVIFFANSVLIFIRFIKSKKDRTAVLFLTLLAMMSVGMFTVLDQHGYRTFYLSVCLVAAISLYIINIIKREYGANDILEKAQPVLNTATVIACLCFSVILTCLTVQNYDVSLMRERYVAEKSAQGETEIHIPKLPNKRICSEDYFMKFEEYLSDNYGEAEYTFVDMEDWELNESYQSMQDDPVLSLTYALENYNFNNPLK